MSTEPGDIAAVKSDRCPFCGAERIWSQGQSTDYACKTRTLGCQLDPLIGNQCLKNQLATHAKLLQEAEDVVFGLLVMLTKSRPRTLSEALTWGENDEVIRTKAAALLRRLEAARAGGEKGAL